MSGNTFKVFDGDGHVYEDDDELVEYYEGHYKGLKRFKSFGIFPSLDGWARGFILSRGDATRKYSHTDAKIWGEVLDELNAEGSVLYPTAALAFGLMQDIEFAKGTAIAYNNWLEDRYINKDSRLYGVGIMAVQDPKAAVEELVRCATRRKNFVAMFLPTVTVLNRTYGDEFFWPIFEAAEKHNMPLVLHGGPSRGMGFDHFNFRPFCKVHTLEHPVPLMIQLTDVIFSGIFDVFPKLRMGFMEGGCSWVPFMMDRLDYEYGSVLGLPLRGKLKKKKPSLYLSEGDNFWVSFELGEQSLKYTIDAIGSERILYASDYPHEPTEEELLEELPEFIANPAYSLEVKQNVLYNNIKRFYSIR